MSEPMFKATVKASGGEVLKENFSLGMLPIKGEKEFWVDGKRYEVLSLLQIDGDDAWVITVKENPWSST
jgi:hypothetical protein